MDPTLTLSGKEPWDATLSGKESGKTFVCDVCTKEYKTRSGWRYHRTRCYPEPEPTPAPEPVPESAPEPVPEPTPESAPLAPTVPIFTPPSLHHRVFSDTLLPVALTDQDQDDDPKPELYGDYFHRYYHRVMLAVFLCLYGGLCGISYMGGFFLREWGKPAGPEPPPPSPKID